MSSQEHGQQPLGNQNQRPPLRRPSGSRNLYQDYHRSFETYYDRERGERRPVQSGFVSSTTWTANDYKWYKAQTVYAPSNMRNGAVQDSRVTYSQKEIDEHLVRELLND